MTSPFPDVTIAVTHFDRPNVLGVIVHWTEVHTGYFGQITFLFDTVTETWRVDDEHITLETLAPVLRALVTPPSIVPES